MLTMKVIVINEMQFEITPFVQPIIDATLNKVVGSEVLVRFKYDEVFLGAELLEFCDNTQSLNHITCHLLEAVEEEIKGKHLEPTFYFTFNINLDQLLDYEVVRKIEHLQKITNITLELLESYDIESNKSVLEEAKPIVHRLKKLGVKFSIDDFGTGYTAFSSLDKLNVDIIKIDKSYLSEDAGTLTYHKFISLLTYVSSKYGITLIAEGIETRNQFKLVTELGINLMQGYLFSPPILLSTFVDSSTYSLKASPFI